MCVGSLVHSSLSGNLSQSMSGFVTIAVQIQTLGDLLVVLVGCLGELGCIVIHISLDASAMMAASFFHFHLK